MKIILIILLVLVFCSCKTMQGRIAEATGCKKEDVIIAKRTWNPLFVRYDAKCKKKSYVCIEAPYRFSCEDSKAKAKSKD